MHRVSSVTAWAPRREGVAQQHDVTDLPDLGERRAPVGVPRERAVADEAAGPGVADEERRDHEVQLVGEVGGQELGVHRAAALDHEPPHAAGVQVLADPAHVRPAAPPSTTVATAPSRLRASPHASGCAVDELLAVAGRRRSPRPGRASPRLVTVTLIGDGRQPAGDPSPPGAPGSAPAAAGCRSGWSLPRPGWRRTPARTSSTRSKSASLDSTQARCPTAFDVAVDRHAAAQHRVGAVSHGRRLPGFAHRCSGRHARQRGNAGRPREARTRRGPPRRAASRRGRGPRTSW